MSFSGEDLKLRIKKEIHFYRAQNENMSREIRRLEDALINNRERYEKIREDYEESQEMVRVMKLITR